MQPTQLQPKYYYSQGSGDLTLERAQLIAKTVPTRPAFNFGDVVQLVAHPDCYGVIIGIIAGWKPKPGFSYATAEADDDFEIRWEYMIQSTEFFVQAEDGSSFVPISNDYSIDPHSAEETDLKLVKLVNTVERI